MFVTDVRRLCQVDLHNMSEPDVVRVDNERNNDSTNTTTNTTTAGGEEFRERKVRECFLDGRENSTNGRALWKRR